MVERREHRWELAAVAVDHRRQREEEGLLPRQLGQLEVGLEALQRRWVPREEPTCLSSLPQLIYCLRRHPT